MPVILAEFRIRGVLVMLVSVFSGGCVERAGATHARIQATATGANRGAVCAAIRGAGNSPIIDDFESQSPRILGNEGRSGWWFSYDDGTGGKLKRETIGVDADTGKRRALHVASSGFAKQRRCALRKHGLGQAATDLGCACHRPAGLVRKDLRSVWAANAAEEDDLAVL